MESDLPRTPTRTVVGVVIGTVAAVALLIGAAVFVFYGYCEDSCDKPPRTLSGAVGSAMPFLLIALLLLTVACYLFMRRGRSGVGRWAVASGLAILSSVAFVGGLYVLAYGLGLFIRYDDSSLFILGLVVLVPLWLWLTAGAARLAAGSSLSRE